MAKRKKWSKFLNTNSIHNLLNVIMSVVSVWGLIDWTQFGFAKETALAVVAACGVIKLTINAIRDGLKGMVEPQPPVAKS